MNLKRVQEKLPFALYRVAQLLEILVGVILIAAIVLSLASVVLGLGELARDLGDPDAFQTFLALAFNVIIGIEFLKMLCRHNMSSAVEVLLFAIARQMVIEHTTPVENLLMVTAIAILFAIRKFLFIRGLDDKHPGDPRQEPAEPSMVGKRED